MSDRELLELAARAAGLEYGVIHYMPRIKCDMGWTPWNPLGDDGDAFRLKVKLNMCATSFSDEAMVGVVIGRDGKNFHEPAGNDPAAAMRRCITRAAAEIQRQRDSK